MAEKTEAVCVVYCLCFLGRTFVINPCILLYDAMVFLHSIIIIIIQLLVNDNCNYGSVRLVNGRTRNEGIVEVCLNGVWSTIKSYRWNTLDAEVVCRQLGMPWECESYNHT